MWLGINDATIIKWVHNVKPGDVISVEYPERMCTEKKFYIWGLEWMEEGSWPSKCQTFYLDVSLAWV